jgi:hypothetical protein
LPAFLGVPKSFAARATKASRTNSAPETPAISLGGVYRKAFIKSTEYRGRLGPP